MKDAAADEGTIMGWWQASVTFESDVEPSEEIAFALHEALSGHSAAVSIGRAGGTITLSIESGDTLEAASEAIRLSTAATEPLLHAFTIVGLEVVTEAAVEAELARPLFPEVVGYAEIAELAGVSRQRARQFARLDGFPRPVIETAQGPLMGKHAVMRWLENRNTTSGRPRKRASA